MVLHPSESVTVCNGSTLELQCTTPGNLLEWSFNVTREANGQRVLHTRLLSTHSGTSRLQTDFTNFTFSRIPAQSRLPVPLVSRVLITPTYTGLNGTEFKCEDVATSESSTTLVYVTNEDSVYDQGSLWN